MRYQLPPDLLHYEVRMIFGLTAQDIMVSGLIIVVGIQNLGIFAGLSLGVVSLLGLKKYERLGNRSPLVYLLQWSWNRYHPQRSTIPRVLPGGSGVSLTVTDWEGVEMYRMEETR